MKTILTGVLVVSLATGLLALSPEERGLEIAKNIDSYDTGWINQVSDVQMILKNQHGQTSEREMRIKTLEDMNKEDDLGDKSLTTFRTPKDVKGTSFLSFSYAKGSDEQWLYLPALRRVKKIASDNKSGPFMGSEFAFEDISSQEVDKYSYKFISEEKQGDLMIAMIERYPVDKNSGYTKQIVWVDTEQYRIQKIDFYDRKGSLLKTLTYSGYKQYPGNTWRPDVMAMENHQSGKSTQLIWKNYVFNSGINEKDFNKNALKRLK